MNKFLGSDKTLNNLGIDFETLDSFTAQPVLFVSSDDLFPNPVDYQALSKQSRKKVKQEAFASFGAFADKYAGDYCDEIKKGVLKNPEIRDSEIAVMSGGSNMGFVAKIENLTLEDSPTYFSVVFIPGERISPKEMVAEITGLKADDITCTLADRSFWQAAITGHEVYHLWRPERFMTHPRASVKKIVQAMFSPAARLYEESMGDFFGLGFGGFAGDSSARQQYADARMIRSLQPVAPEYKTGLVLNNLLATGKFPDLSAVLESESSFNPKTRQITFDWMKVRMIAARVPSPQIKQAEADFPFIDLSARHLITVISHAEESGQITTPIQRQTSALVWQAIQRLCPEAVSIAKSEMPPMSRLDRVNSNGFNFEPERSVLQAPSSLSKSFGFGTR